MNIRKNIDYSETFAALDQVMTADRSQIERYCEIGRLVCARSEKGAAVAVAEYLTAHYPEMTGFSPRNLRRMRDFYKLYAECPAPLSLAMQIGWTQNVVILEADLTMEQRDWYLRATARNSWSKNSCKSKSKPTRTCKKISTTMTRCVILNENNRIRLTALYLIPRQRL